MKKSELSNVSRRERQILDLIYQNGPVTATQLRNLLPDDLTNSGVRTLLRVLVEKGLLKRNAEGFKYVYSPAIEIEEARISALQHLKRTFFKNSTEQVVSTLLRRDDVKEEELDNLLHLIKKTKEEMKK